MSKFNDFVDIINDYDLSGEEVLKILTDWHGTILISDEFLDNLKNVEGYK